MPPPTDGAQHGEREWICHVKKIDDKFNSSKLNNICFAK
jgi:hypothetical protein